MAGLFWQADPFACHLRNICLCLKQLTLDYGSLNMINHLSHKSALNVLEKMLQSDLPSLVNPSAYLMSLIKSTNAYEVCIAVRLPCSM